MMPRLSIIPILILFWLPAIALAATEASPESRRVYVAAGILDVDTISSAEQSFTINLFLRFRWIDPELAHEGDGPIRKNLSDISAPRFVLVNRQKTWSTLMNVVDIFPSGEVIFRQRLWGDFSQPLSLHDFPFDSHTFSIPILALSQSIGTVELVADPRSDSFVADELSVADWEVTGWSAEAANIELTRGQSGKGFVVNIEARRIYNHFVIKYIIPLILIVMMSWIVFWIDAEESSSQLSVAVTAALTLIAYHIALASKLPDIPYLTRLDMFLFGSTLMVFSTLLEVVVTSRIAKAGHVVAARWTDRACAFLFPGTYIVIAGYSLGIPDIMKG